MRIIAITFASAFALTSAAHAAEFTAADADGDGVLSVEEFTAVYPELPQGTFALVDIDETGTVTEGEMSDALTAGVLPTPEG